MQLPEQSALQATWHLSQFGVGQKIGPFQLTDPATGQPVDLSPASTVAKFSMLRVDPPPQAVVQENVAATIETPAAAGKVSYTFVAADVAKAGDFVAEFWAKIGGTTPDTAYPRTLKIPVKIHPTLSTVAP